MTDQELIITALRQSGVSVTEHLKPANQIEADETIARLIAILDRQDLAAAMNQLGIRHGLRVVQ
jgi:hypothetical protein